MNFFIQAVQKLFKPVKIWHSYY